MSLASPAYHGGSHFFLFVVIFSFIMTVMWCFVYFLGIKDVLNLPINWLLSVNFFHIFSYQNDSLNISRNLSITPSRHSFMSLPLSFNFQRGSEAIQFSAEVTSRLAFLVSSTCSLTHIRAIFYICSINSQRAHKN